MLSQRQVEKPCNDELRWGQGRAETQSTFRTNFPKMPCSTGYPAKGERGGVALQGGGGGVSSGLVQPFGSFGGLARVYVHSFLTVLTLHGTTPFEFALTLGDLLDSCGVVAPATAHDLATVCAA